MLLPRLGEGRDGEYPVRDFVVTPASEPESPASIEGFKLIFAPSNPSNYAIPGRIWIIRVVGKLIVSLHLTGLVRIRTHRFPPPYGLGSHSLTHRPTENPTGMTKESVAPHPIPPRVGEGILQIPFPS